MSAIPKYDRTKPNQEYCPWQDSPWNTRPADYSLVRPPSRQTNYRGYRIQRKPSNYRSLKKPRTFRITDLTLLLLLASLATILAILLLLIS